MVENKKKYISINAEILGRSYKIAKRCHHVGSYGGLLIWSSGSGVNIVGTDGYSLIFFHDEKGYISDDFPLKSIFFCSSKFIKNEKLMRNLIKSENHHEQVCITDDTSSEALIRSTFLHKDINKVYRLKLENSKRTTSLKEIFAETIYCNSNDDQSFDLKMLRSNIFPIITSQTSKSVSFCFDEMKILDNLFLKRDTEDPFVRGSNNVSVHFTHNGMLCGIRKNAFALIRPSIHEKDTKNIKDVFEPSKDSNNNILEIAFSKRKYEEIYKDLKDFFPDLGFENSKEVLKQSEQDSTLIWGKRKLPPKLPK